MLKFDAAAAEKIGRVLTTAAHFIFFWLRYEKEVSGSVWSGIAARNYFFAVVRIPTF